MTHEFLTDEWIEEAKRLRDEAGPVATPPAQVIRMNQIVTDVPFGDGEVRAFLDTSDGRVVLDSGQLDDPDLTITLAYETAKAVVVDGDFQKALEAFMAGKIKVQGDMTKLMALQAAPPDAAAVELALKIKAMTS